MEGSGRANGLAPRWSVGVGRFQTEDREALAGFLGRHYGADSYQADRRFFDWRFGDGPEGPPIWLCRRDGGIVGLQCALPMALEVDGRPLPAAWAIDLMVDPEWRLRGVAPALTGRLCEAHAVVAGLGIAQPARRAFARAGWLDLGYVPRHVRLLRPLRPGQAPTGRKAVGRAAAWASRLGAPALAVMAGLDAVALGAARAAGLRFEAVECFDARVEAVWRAVAPLHRLIARRDLAALAWRFDAAPMAGAYRRHYLTRGGEAVGYAVLRRRGESMMVVDYLCRPAWRWALFAHCLAEARRHGAVALRCLASARGERAGLAALGFLARPGPYFMVFANPAAGLSADVVGALDAWYLTEADSDLDHPPLP